MVCLCCCIKWDLGSQCWSDSSVLTCVNRSLSKIQKMVIALCSSKVFQNAPIEHSAILLTFINLQFIIKNFLLSIFEWPFYTGYTVPCEYEQRRFWWQGDKYQNSQSHVSIQYILTGKRNVTVNY